MNIGFGAEGFRTLGGYFSSIVGPDWGTSI